MVGLAVALAIALAIACSCSFCLLACLAASAGGGEEQPSSVCLLGAPLDTEMVQPLYGNTISQLKALQRIQTQPKV
jgi:poly-beta-hydroxyalkanoate depolymerase